MQSKIKKNEFKEGYLSTGEKIVLFRREILPLFFDKLPTLFENKKTDEAKIGIDELNYQMNALQMLVDMGGNKKELKEWREVIETLQMLIDELNVTTKKNTIVAEANADYLTGKLLEITDKKLLTEIKPLLKKNRVLEVVEICSKHYTNKYKNMNFKDWFKLVNDLYKKMNV
ncbi:MAG: hypothetical protein H7331_07840 [Bacteroidia bacterium]|nr:hypothetical protein [Bacteroidia bacterium]